MRPDILKSGLARFPPLGQILCPWPSSARKRFWMGTRLPALTSPIPAVLEPVSVPPSVLEAFDEHLPCAGNREPRWDLPPDICDDILSTSDLPDGTFQMPNPSPPAPHSLTRSPPYPSPWQPSLWHILRLLLATCCSAGTSVPRERGSGCFIWCRVPAGLAEEALREPLWTKARKKVRSLLCTAPRALCVCYFIPLFSPPRRSPS